MKELNEDRIRIIVSEELTEYVRKETYMLNHEVLEKNISSLKDSIKTVDRKLWVILTLLVTVLLGVFLKTM